MEISPATDQQIVDYLKKHISLNENFHFPEDFFSSKFQEIEMEFQEVATLVY